MNFATLIEPKTWSIKQLVEKIDNEEISLPKFQRSQVWTKPKQKALMKSVASGYPIGCFLLFEDSSGKTQVIDGLQRATAFYKYSKQPLSFIDIEEVAESNDAFSNACKTVRDAYFSCVATDRESRMFKEAINSWLENTTISDPSSFSSSTLSKKLISHFIEVTNCELDNALNARFALQEAIEDSRFLNTLKDAVDLEQYQFPVVYYKGSKKNLPAIFDAVNVGGQKLNKYEILAAQWFDSCNNVRITNTGIKNAIYDKYQQVIDSGFAVEGVDHDEDSYTLFEYLFGEGKVLARRNGQILFEEKDDATDVESFAFTLACISYGVRLADMSGLPGVIRNAEGNPPGMPLDLTNYHIALCEAVDFVSDVLRPYIGVSFQKPFIAHTEYQICSYVARVLIGMHEPGSWGAERDTWKEEKKKLKKTLPEHYLYELLTNHWGNAGDSKMFNSVWDGKQPSTTYLFGYSQDEWETALKVWFSNDLRKNQRARSSIDPVSKVILKYTYGMIATAAELQEKFDIDHVLPIKQLSTRINEIGENEGWPMSTIGNLAFIASKNNKRKKDKSLSVYFSQFEGDPAMQETIRRFYLCNHPEDILDLDSSWSRETFEEFAQTRFELIKKHVLERFEFEYITLSDED